MKIKIRDTEFENLQEYCERTGKSYEYLRKKARTDKNFKKLQGGWWIKTSKKDAPS